MSGSKTQSRILGSLLLALGATAAIGLTGCQTSVGGQTLPSPYYLQDDVQYHPPGPQMKLAREAAAQKAYNQDEALRQK